MDISHANTFAYRVFDETYNSVDNLAKIGPAAFRVLHAAIQTPDPSGALAALVNNHGIRVGANMPSPEAKVDAASGAFNRLCLLEIFAAFESYHRNIVAEMSFAAFAFRRRKPIRHADHDPETSVNKYYPSCCEVVADQWCRKNSLKGRLPILMKHLDGSTLEIRRVLPLFHYFRCVRNSIAHDAARASRELAGYCDRRRLGLAFVAMATPARWGTPDAVPMYRHGDAIAVRTRDVVLAGMLCKRIVRSLDRAAVARLGTRGLLWAATHHAVLHVAPAPSRKHAGSRKPVAKMGSPSKVLSSGPRAKSIHRTAEGAVNLVLTDILRVRGVGAAQTVVNLKAAGLWKRSHRRWLAMKASESQLAS